MENKKEKISNQESAIKQKLIGIIRKNRQVHIWTPDIKIRYIILKILSQITQTYYVVHEDHVDAISLFLDQWDSFGLKVESAIYPRDIGKKKLTSKLIITSKDYILDHITHSDDFTFTKIIIFDDGLEIDSKNMIINHIWKKYTNSKPRLVYFSPPNELNNEVYSLGHYPHRVIIVYIKEDVGDVDDMSFIGDIYDRTAKIVLDRYVSLVRGCCIVIFVANIDQEIELRDRLIQIDDNILSSISGNYQAGPRNNRPKIIITNYSFDVRALADVSIVIDLMMEESNHKIRYISKHKADEHLRRVNMDNGICFRMISFNSYLELLEVHSGYYQEHHKLLLIKDGNKIDVSEDDILTYKKLGYIDKSSILTELGHKASVLPINPRTFSLIDNWKKSGEDLFPAVVISSLLEFGDVVVSREKRHQLYYGKDDVETFLNVYLDLLNEYKGVPSMDDYDSIVWVQKWSNERGFNYESIRKINLIIREIYQRLNSEYYSLSLNPFLLSNTMKKVRELAPLSYPVAKYENDLVYVGEDGTRYLLGENQYHTIQIDRPDKIIILATTKNNLNEDLNIKLALTTENSLEIPILEIPIYPISKLITEISKYAVDTNFKDYIDKEFTATSPEEKINTINIQTMNKNIMAPRYELWLDATPPINKYTVKDGDLYTHQEAADINELIDFESTITSDFKELKSRSIDFILDATVTWEDRGKLLVEREYLTQNVPNGNLVVWIGNFNKYISRSFSNIKFLVYTDYNIGYSDNVQFGGKTDKAINYNRKIRPH